YTNEHEWVLATDDGNYRIGITDYAQDALGDVVFVELPEAGASYELNATMAEVESTKSVAEVYAPMAGSIVEANASLVESPDLINREPYGEGWFVVMEISDPAAFEGLLDAEGYKALTE
ncbi:MAG: glycine cleavage system protein GcvH, partial [Acidimicrobiia bacterium]|nr:glycine cleavage system protein GcvH [Acidimicrobiia bacterium]